MKTILLTHGKVAIVDDDDYPFLSRLTWSAKKSEGTWYACTNGVIGKVKRMFLMHRMILGFPKSEVDHRDGDGLNNTRKNIRKATKSQNQHNRRLQKNNTSGVKGV